MKEFLFTSANHSYLVNNLIVSGWVLAIGAVLLVGMTPWVKHTDEKIKRNKDNV